MNNRNIYFTEEVSSIIEQYMTENSCNFNKAVNDLILEAHKLQSEQILKDFLQDKVKRIETGIVKLHKQLKIEGYD